MRTVFTTGQVAKICEVAPRTVSKWIDSGHLTGYRIPGSKARRIPREHLVRFLREYKMPLGELEGEALDKLLIVGADSAARDGLTEALGGGEFEVATAATGFEAGIQAERFQPGCVVIDFAIGRGEALAIAANLKENCYTTVLVGLLSDDDIAAIGIGRTIFSDKFRKPFDAVLLAERIRTLVSRKRG